MIEAGGFTAELEVDGGIKKDNVGKLVEAGADVIVAGSAVFNDRSSVAQALGELRKGIGA